MENDDVEEYRLAQMEEDRERLKLMALLSLEDMPYEIARRFFKDRVGESVGHEVAGLLSDCNLMNLGSVAYVEAYLSENIKTYINTAFMISCGAAPRTLLEERLTYSDDIIINMKVKLIIYRRIFDFAQNVLSEIYLRSDAFINFNYVNGYENSRLLCDKLTELVTVNVSTLVSHVVEIELISSV